MHQRSVFKRNNLAFFVLSRMRLTALFYGLFGLALWGCETPSEDPALLGPTSKMTAIRFDSAFFAMDSLHFESDLAKLVQQYPQFSEDYFNRILMLSPKKESKKIGAFYKAYRPIFNATTQIPKAICLFLGIPITLFLIHISFSILRNSFFVLL